MHLSYVLSTLLSRKLICFLCGLKTQKTRWNVRNVRTSTHSKDFIILVAKPDVFPWAEISQSVTVAFYYFYLKGLQCVSLVTTIQGKHGGRCPQCLKGGQNHAPPWAKVTAQLRHPDQVSPCPICVSLAGWQDEGHTQVAVRAVPHGGSHPGLRAWSTFLPLRTPVLCCLPVCPCWLTTQEEPAPMLKPESNVPFLVFSSSGKIC